MDSYQEPLGIPLTIEGTVDWGNVPYPRGAVGSIRSLKRQIKLKKQLYFVIPHHWEIIRVHVGANYNGDQEVLFLKSGGAHSFSEANISQRVPHNANFVFHNYWQAYAYLLKYKKLPRSAYIV